MAWVLKSNAEYLRRANYELYWIGKPGQTLVDVMSKAAADDPCWRGPIEVTKQEDDGDFYGPRCKANSPVV